MIGKGESSEKKLLTLMNAWIEKKWAYRRFVLILITSVIYRRDPFEHDAP